MWILTGRVEDKKAQRLRASWTIGNRPASSLYPGSKECDPNALWVPFLSGVFRLSGLRAVAPWVMGAAKAAPHAPPDPLSQSRVTPLADTGMTVLTNIAQDFPTALTFLALSPGEDHRNVI